MDEICFKLSPVCFMSSFAFFSLCVIRYCCGDRHITEFFTESFPRGEYYGKTLGMDAFSFEGTIEYGDAIYKKMTALAATGDPLPEDFFDGFTGEHEQLMDIIASIRKDSRQVFSVNLPNKGAVPNLPAHAALMTIPKNSRHCWKLWKEGRTGD